MKTRNMAEIAMLAVVVLRIMSIDEICYKISGTAMAVHRHFGPGYLEEVCKNALMVPLNPVNPVNPV